MYIDHCSWNERNGQRCFDWEFGN